MNARMINTACAIAVWLLLAASPHLAAQEQITLNIVGEVTAAPCDTVFGLNQTVLLDKHPIHTLATAGSETDKVFFEIRFEDCPATTRQVTMQFGSATDAATEDPNAFVNRVSTTPGEFATHVALKVYRLHSQQNELIKPGGTVMVAVANDTALGRFAASIYSQNGNATEGQVKVEMPLIVTYK